MTRTFTYDLLRAWCVDHGYGAAQGPVLQRTLVGMDGYEGVYETVFRAPDDERIWAFEYEASEESGWCSMTDVHGTVEAYEVALVKRTVIGYERI